MPARSQKQQQFFGMLDAIRKGEMKDPPENLKRLAFSMKHQSIRDYAATKHTGLPKKVNEEKVAAILSGFCKAAAEVGISEEEALNLLRLIND